jgi:hypothetical protein
MGCILGGNSIFDRGFQLVWYIREELVRSVPGGGEPIIGGEMEGVGLLAASTATDDPIWCVVKGISDFAEENRDTVINTNRPIACRNAAKFVVSALVNDMAC